MKLGVQLYSLRNQIKELGVEEVLKMVAKAGYSCVEFAGFYGLTPKEMKALLDKYHLEGISAHIKIDEIIPQLDYIDEIGIKSVYIPWMSGDDLKNNMDALVEQIKTVKKELDKRGVVFGYHNHDQEYKNGEDLVKQLLDKTEGFYSEIDTYWVKMAGLDPVEKMKEYGDRLKCLHIKELKTVGVKTDPNPVVGEGCVGFKEIFDLGNKMGIQLAILEVEGFPCEPAEYLKRSYENMKKLSNKILRLGIIGCGGIANGKHMPAEKRNPRAEMVAFCDIIPERAQKAKEEYGTEDSAVYTDYKELLKDETIDAVLVLTHNKEHCRITVDALNAGKHVLCEKPMATTYEEAVKMIEAAKKNNKVLTIGYQNRWRPDSMYMKQMAKDGEFGEVYYAEAIAIRRRAVPTWGVFIDEEKQGGGPLIDIGTHALDLTLHMMDNYEPAYCVGKTFHKLNKNTETGNAWGDWDVDRFTAEDSAFGFIVMKNGAVIYLKSSWALNMADPKEAITTICGDKAGADMLDGLRINGVKNGRQYIMKPNFSTGGVAFFDGAGGKEPADYEAANFSAAILDGQELNVKPEQAAVVTRILEGIYKSQQTGKPYYFD
ncbi:MAG TPA: Gfo/Idh/MocA family oxidoreductase [Firmicutes bacterium]|nr:Gfo/Idh/MocA family oxidoreductase [Bacillota bacterium]